MTTPWIVAFVALWALVVLLGLLVLGALRRLVPLIERSEELVSSAARSLTIGGLAPGGSVPSFTAEDIHGATFADTDFEEAPTIILFLEPACKACELLVRDLQEGQVPDLGARLVVVSSDRAEAERLARSSEVMVIVDGDRSVARAFQSAVSPQTFVVDEHRMVLASGTPNEWDELRRLVMAAKGGDRESDVPAAAVAS